MKYIKYINLYYSLKQIFPILSRISYILLSYHDKRFIKFTPLIRQHPNLVLPCLLFNAIVFCPIVLVLLITFASQSGRCRSLLTSALLTSCHPEAFTFEDLAFCTVAVLLFCILAFILTHTYTHTHTVDSYNAYFCFSFYVASAFNSMLLIDIANEVISFRYSLAHCTIRPSAKL